MLSILIIALLVASWAFVAYHDIKSSKLNNSNPNSFEKTKIFRTKDSPPKTDIKKLAIFNGIAFLASGIFGLLIYRFTEFGAGSFAAFPLFAAARLNTILENYKIYKKWKTNTSLS